MAKPFIHESAYVDDGAQIGAGTKVWHFCHVLGGAVIGERCSLGQNVVVMNGVRIGNNVKIQNNVSVYEGVELEDDVLAWDLHADGSWSKHPTDKGINAQQVFEQLAEARAASTNGSAPDA